MAVTSASRSSDSITVTSWQAAIFFQFFVALIQILLAVWYAIVMFSPTSISEYLPHEQTPTVFMIARFVIAAAIWLPIMYFTWKRNRMALLASIIYSAALLIIVPVLILSASGHPDFSDLVLFPVDTLLVIFSVLAWRTFSRQSVTT